MNKTVGENRYSNVCRTCLSEQKVMKSIFTVEEILEYKSTIKDILMVCASVQVLESDGLPEKVCYNCAQEMNRAFIFRKLCEKSDATLRDWISHEALVQKTLKLDESNEVCQEEPLQHLLGEEDEIIKKKVKKKSQAQDCVYGQMEGEDCGSYHCKLCNKKSKESLNNHASLHKTKPTKRKPKKLLPKTCEICGKTFRFHSNLERHKLIHTGEKPYLCNVCGKGFAQMSYLKIHSFIHTGEKPYQCKMCEKSFSAPGTLMTHTRTHTGERPHKCQICGKNFPQSGYLSAHIRTHTGEKPIECKVCHRRFNQSGRLIIHMRTHSGEKPYSCGDCGRRFALKGTLKKHIRTHTGERPYICNVCGQAFAQSGTLATHMKVHKKT